MRVTQSMVWDRGKWYLKGTILRKKEEDLWRLRAEGG